MEVLISKYQQVVDPVYEGDIPATEMKLSYINYNAESMETKDISTIDEIMKLKDDSHLLWINVSGLKDVDSIKRLGELLAIHPLTIEDILHTEQQAKMEMFDNYRFLLAKTIIQRKFSFQRQSSGKKKPLLAARTIGSIAARFPRKNKNPDNIESDGLVVTQIGIVIMKNVLITFQEFSRGAFQSIREKIIKNTGEIRNMTIDYIAYLIIEKIIGEYFTSIEHLEEHIEDLEDRATKTSDNKYIEEIQETKKYLLRINKEIKPLKDNLTSISLHESFFQTGEFKPFLRDLIENLNHAVSMVEHYREWLTTIMDVNVSIMSYQLNTVMKMLTMITAIFIPLSFIAGVYGMNFEHMPELTHKFAYFIVLGVMLIIAVIMVAVFKKKRWF